MPRSAAGEKSRLSRNFTHALQYFALLALLIAAIGSRPIVSVAQRRGNSAFVRTRRAERAFSGSLSVRARAHGLGPCLRLAAAGGARLMEHFFPH